MLPAFQHRDTASESTHGLREFKPYETSANNYEVLRRTIQFQRFDMGHRLPFFEAWDIRNGCVGANIHNNLIARKDPHSSVVRRHLDTVFGAMKCASPMINSAPLSL